VMRVVVTGAFGFIGSHLCALLSERGDRFVAVDACTYAAVNRRFVEDLRGLERVVVGRVESPSTWGAVSRTVGPFDGVLHLAAETHVDRSIGLEPTTLRESDDVGGPLAFVRSNVEGTALVASFCASTSTPLVHVSTDEVYGDVEGAAAPSVEGDPLRASSPYSASKVAAEYVVAAWRRTFGLRSRVVRPSNAYGERQTRDKLIPVAIGRLSRGEPVPLYAGGLQSRQWVSASDVALGVVAALERGRDGDAYNLGGSVVSSNRDLVEALAREVPSAPRPAWVEVADRPGHDVAYRVDSRAAEAALGWRPSSDVVSSIRSLVAAYSSKP